MKIKFQIHQMWILIPVILLFTQINAQSIIFKNRLLNDSPYLVNSSSDPIDNSIKSNNNTTNSTINLEPNSQSLNESSIKSNAVSLSNEQRLVNQTTLLNSESNVVKTLKLNSSDSKSEQNGTSKDFVNRLVEPISSDLFINKTITTDSTAILDQPKEASKQTNSSKVERLPTAESSTVEETKLLDNRSTNEEDEFEEFEGESKKEDESSVIEHDKGNNLLENNNQLNKAIKEDKLKDNESTSKAIKEENEEEDETSDYTANRPNKPQTSLNSLSKNESSSLANDLEHEDDDEDDEEEEINHHKKSSDQSNDKEARKRKVFGEKERKSLLKLQDFILGLVEQGLKSALPQLLKVGYETNVSTTCTNSFMAVTRGLQGTKQWAYKLLDASGKPPSGILDGTLTDFGAFEECLSIDTRLDQPDELNHFTGKYCILDVKPEFDADLPMNSLAPLGIKNDSVLWHPSLQIFWSRNSLLSFRYGLCAPSACSNADLQILAEYFFKSTGMEAEVGFCQLSNEQTADTLQIILIFILAVILLTVFIGTILEISLKRLDKHQLLTSNKKSLVDFLICFSIILNTKKLLNIKNQNLAHKSQLKHLDGVRFLSTCWIIMGHTYFYTDFVHYHHFRSLAHFKYLDDSFWFMPIANFTLSVETYFFISGMLVVYASWKKLKNSNGKINVLEFLVHRVWRIWPPYLAIIAFVLILPLFGSGPLWPEAVKNTAAVCRKNWWYNVLFINNFQKPDEVCLFHTWFLSANIQFHLMAVPLLFILYRYPKFCFTLCTTFILACIAWVFHYAQINNLTIPGVIADDVFVDHDQNILTLYILPYYHFGSYLLGMMLGYFLITRPNPTILSSKSQLGYWCLSLIALAIVIFLPHSSYKGEPTSLIFSSIYLSLHRIIWSLGFGWLVFACANSQGYFINSILSYEVFRPLSSLSYLAYLIHPILMLYHTGKVRERVNLSHYQLLNTFLARCILAFSSAYLIYVIVELPFANIEKYLFPKKKQPAEQIDKIDSSSNVQLPKNNSSNYSKSLSTTYQLNNQPNHFSRHLGNVYPNNINQLASNQKRIISDYYTPATKYHFNQMNPSNFKEKHHLNLGNQRKQDRQDRYLADRNFDDRRQINKINQQYPYLNEQDQQLNRKYLLYRQKQINQYYFHTGSRTNARSKPTTNRSLKEPNLNDNKLSQQHLSEQNTKTDAQKQHHQTKTISSEHTITLSSVSTSNLPTNDQTEMTTNDTQLTETLANETSNNSNDSINNLTNLTLTDSSMCEINESNQLTKAETSTGSSSLS